MVKLTPDLINQSMQYINPVRDRELDLRGKDKVFRATAANLNIRVYGYKIPVIENMGATLDQFDTIDLSDNDIRKLDGFPLLKRLKCLLLNNNRIVRISDTLAEQLPSIESLILTGNQMQELGDMDPLVNLKSLSTLSLLYNPVTSRPHYRLYLIYKLPQLRLLDFQKIKQKEREEAKALFKSKVGKEIQREIAKKAKTFVPGAGLPADTANPKGPSAEDLWKMREAISKASSLEEIERLNRLLQAGQIPGKKSERAGLVSGAEEEEEEDDTMDTSQQASNGN